MNWGRKTEDKDRTRGLEEEVRNLQALTSQLKEQRREAASLVQKYGSGIPLLKYLCAQGVISDPYLFLDRSGIILEYTPSITTLLDASEDLHGRDYIETLATPKETNDKLRRYLLSDEKLEIKYTLRKKKKEKELFLKKHAPFKVELDLSMLGTKGVINEVSIIPIELKCPWFFEHRKTPNLSKLLGLSDQESMSSIYLDLIRRGKTADWILQYEASHGELGLIETWLGIIK